MKTAIVLGTFDLTHYGHYEKFRKLKELGYNTVAGVTTDSFAASYKRLPVLTLSERRLNLDACKYVDKVIVNLGGHDSKKDILTAQADVIVHGSDWSEEDYFKQVGISQAWLDEHDIQMLVMPYTKGISTTEIRRRVKDAKE